MSLQPRERRCLTAVTALSMTWSGVMRSLYFMWISAAGVISTEQKQVIREGCGCEKHWSVASWLGVMRSLCFTRISAGVRQMERPASQSDASGGRGGAP